MADVVIAGYGPAGAAAAIAAHDAGRSVLILVETWFDMGGGAAGGLCGERDGYIHPSFPQALPPSVTPSGAPQDP